MLEDVLGERIVEVPAGAGGAVTGAGVEALCRAVAAAKEAAGDPFARVWVVPPTAASALSLRHALARQGVVNVELAPLVRLAEAAVGGGGLPRLGRAARRRLVASVAAGLGLGGASSHPATIEALDGVFRELRACAGDALDEVRASSARGSLVVGLYDEFRALSSEWWDEGDVFEAAASSGAAVEGSVVLYEPGRLGAPEARFVGSGVLDVAAVVRSAGGGGGVGGGLPGATRAVVAPDVEAEVRVAVGAVVEAALVSGVPFSRMAVVHPGGEPYARLIGELLGAAGVPWGGPAATTVGESVAGRTLAAALALPGAGWSRAALMQLLAAGPIVPDGVRAGWEAAARDANVVAGLATWSARLARVERPAAAALADWVSALARALDGPGVGGWAAYARWADELSQRLLPAGAPDGSSALVAGALAPLAALDGVGRAPDLAVFVDAATAQLAMPAPWRPVGDGVLVCPLFDAIGVDAEVVVAVGMQEGRLPARRRDDPLLPDAVRAAAGGALATRRSKREDERRALALVLGGARVRVVTAARADQRAQQSRRPSRWFGEAATAGGVAIEEVPSLAAVVGAVGGVGAGGGASAQDMAMRALLDGDAEPAAFGLGRGFAATAARLASTSSEWDGAVGPHPYLALGDRLLSPTSVETWASCPFRYFLRSVLRVRETVVPEQRLSIEARDRGTLVHEVLERVVGAALAGVGYGPDGDVDVDVDVAAIAEEVCARFEAEGRVGRPLPWLLERRTIDAHLRAVLERDRGGDGLRPQRAEVAFGSPEAELPAVEVPLDDGSGRVARFRGQIDRIDAADDGSAARVTDYKTGRSDPYRELAPSSGAKPDDPTLAGTRLQLPIYALAARHLFPDASVSAGYWFVTDAGRGYPRVDVALDDDTFDRLRDVVTHVVGAIEEGVFPPQPGDAVLDSFKECRYCEYDRVCSADRGDAAERKRGDEASVRFLGLRVGGSA